MKDTTSPAQNASETTANWDEFYTRPVTETLREIERSVCGCDFGGCSWTTATEALELARLLRLDSGSNLLDIGSGSGWPGLYLAQQTGCRITLTDVSREGLNMADSRIESDGMSEQCRTVLAGAGELPFDDEEFDAIGHSDVLCCLEDKLEALAQCRRVIKVSGVMAFSVIHMRSGASAREIELAQDAGPALIAAPASYPKMLRQTGWHIEQTRDISDNFTRAVGLMCAEYESREKELIVLLGEDAYTEALVSCRAKLDLLNEGSVQRSLFVVTSNVC